MMAPAPPLEVPITKSAHFLAWSATASGPAVLCHLRWPKCHLGPSGSRIMLPSAICTQSLLIRPSAESVWPNIALGEPPLLNRCENALAHSLLLSTAPWFATGT